MPMKALFLDRPGVTTGPMPMVVSIDWEANRKKERVRVLASCAEFLRARGVVEQVIEDMLREVPAMAEAKR
jgi:hypothetical protein